MTEDNPQDSPEWKAWTESVGTAYEKDMQEWAARQYAEQETAERELLDRLRADTSDRDLLQALAEDDSDMPLD